MKARTTSIRHILIAAITIFAAACGGPAGSSPIEDAISVSSPEPLAIALSAPDQGTVGAPLSVTATATNTDAVNTATSVLVGLSFPLGTQAVGKIPAGCARRGNNFLTCSIGTLAPGASYSLTISATPAAPASSWVVQADVSGVLGTFAVNSVQAPISVIPGATDVQVTGFASNGSPPLGSTFTYTFQVKNGGSQVADAVAFTDTLPASVGLAGASTTASGGSCTAAAGTVSCSLGTLPVGTQALVVITAIAPSTAGAVTNTASVTSQFGDLNLANNSVGVTIQPK